MSRKPNPLLLPLVLALSLLPGAVLADACMDIPIRVSYAREVLGSRIRHYTDSYLNPERFRTKQRIIQKLRELGGRRNVFIVPHSSMLTEDYDKGLEDYDKALTNFDAALEDAERIPLVGELRRIEFAPPPISFIVGDYNFIGNVGTTIPFNTPRETLVQRLSAKLLEHSLWKKLPRGTFIRDDSLSLETYVTTLERLHLALEAEPVPEDFRASLNITVTDRGDMKVNDVRYHGGDGTIKSATLTVPADTLDKFDPIMTAILESQVGKMLEQFNYADLRWHRLGDINSAVANGGVDEADYKDALKQFIGELQQQKNGHKQRKGKGSDYEQGMRAPKSPHLARIMVTPAGGGTKLKPMPGFDPALFEAHVPIDRLSVEGALEASRLLPPHPVPGPARNGGTEGLAGD